MPLLTVPEPDIVLQPKPVLVVQVNALEPAEHDGIVSACGAAGLAVPLPRTVFAVSFAILTKVTALAAIVNAPALVIVASPDIAFHVGSAAP